MNGLFYQLARLSLTAGWMTLLLLALRPLLKKLPRSFSCLLWGLVAVRLMLPVTLESRVSLVPKRIAAPSQMLGSNPLRGLSAVNLPAPAADAGIQWQAVLPVIWAIGMLCMLIYALVSCIRLAKQVKISMRMEAGVYLCDNIRSPFVLGIGRPRIYLPSDLDPAMTGSVLAHERAHLRRGDHLWKPLGFLLLSIYWFNPACWLAYVLFCRDMEQACDESAIREMDSNGKKCYSAALLACSINRSAITACPLAFGEVGVKARIRGVLRYRKPKRWVILTAALLCITLSVCLLTDPVKAASPAESAPDALLTLAEDTVLRQGPAERSQAVATLKAGTTVTVLRIDDIGGANWMCAADDSGNMGWMKYDSAAADAPLSEAAPKGTPYTLPQDTVAYSAPTERAKIVASLTAGTDILIRRVELVSSRPWACVQIPDMDLSAWIKYDEASTK